MDHIKESTHNSRKNYHACSKCFASCYLCPKCEGPCIFTRPFLNKVRINKQLQNQLTHEPYRSHIEYLRKVIIETFSQQADQEPMEEVQEHTAIELLETFHKNPYEYQYPTFIDMHRTEYSNRRYRQNRYAIVCSHTTSIKGRCYWDKPIKTGYDGRKSSSRWRKQQKIMNEAVDFTLEVSEMEKELNGRELAFLNM